MYYTSYGCMVTELGRCGRSFLGLVCIQNMGILNPKEVPDEPSYYFSNNESCRMKSIV